MKEKKALLFLAVFLVVGLSWNPCSDAASAKRFNIAVGQEPASMDQTLGYLGADFVVLENYGEYLVYRDPNGDLKPGLATSWKISSDGKVIEFELRKEVKFHTGDPLTTKDVLFSLERARAKNTTVRTRMKFVEKIEVIDDYNFKVHFSAPDVTFIPYRGGVMIASKSYYDKVGEDKFVKQPVGTGPYRVTNYVPGEYVDLERFEEYYGPKPLIKEARFFFVPEDTTRVAKLKAGEVDFIGACPYPSVSDLEKNPKFKVIKLSTGHPTPSVVFQNSNPKTPWYDRRVRLAMAHAIDCEAIIKNILMGYPEHYARLAPWELGYDPELKPYAYDPKRAKELLAEAGYPNGFEFNLYWAITGRTPMTREMTEAIAAYLQAVGIRTKLVGEENATHYARMRSIKKSPEGVFVAFNSVGFVAGAVEPTFILDIILTTDGGFSVYSNPEFDKVVAEARGTVDDAERAKIIKKAVRIAYDEVPNIPICNIVFFYAMKNNIDFIPTQRFSFDLVMLKDIKVK